MPDNNHLLSAILEQAPLEPELLELPGWKPGSIIRVRVKRPSLYALLAENAALNPLIPALDKLFISHDRSDVLKNTNEYAKALVAIARMTLAEPTYDELIEAGVTLTDDQLTDISLYATEGMDFLLRFRARTRAGAGEHGDDVPDDAQPAAAPEGAVPGVGIG